MNPDAALCLRFSCERFFQVKRSRTYAGTRTYMDDKHMFYNVFPEQMLSIRVWDTSTRSVACMGSMSGFKKIGSLLLPVDRIRDQGVLKQEWLLEETKQGAVSMKLTWSNLNK